MHYRYGGKNRNCYSSHEMKPTYIPFTGSVMSLSIHNTKFLSIIFIPNFSVFIVMHLNIVLFVVYILGLILQFVLHSHFITIQYYRSEVCTTHMQFRRGKLLHSNVIPSYYNNF